MSHLPPPSPLTHFHSRVICNVRGRAGGGREGGGGRGAGAYLEEVTLAHYSAAFPSLRRRALCRALLCKRTTCKTASAQDSHKGHPSVNGAVSAPRSLLAPADAISCNPEARNSPISRRGLSWIRDSANIGALLLPLVCLNSRE